MVELHELEPADVLGPQRVEIEALWRRVHPETTAERFAEILPRHAARSGFRFLAARDEGGRLAGLAYGYEGAPGEWWHDRVAEAMSEDERTVWLAPGHFEFVELMVDPALEGRGIGARLHDGLLAGAGSPTAVLSTQRSNARARGFYERRGWETVVPELLFGDADEPYCVLGRRRA
ncbi:MAG TPA: GNAT family N-acetyltransferase [Gaiellaceae bacterium]|jgi:ribosomal protein S18 acetylase RimI-like enzyme